MQQYDSARDAFIKVLKEYDCTNREARSGLRVLDPEKLNELVARCNP